MTSTLFDLSGKVAVITASSRSIGLAFCCAAGRIDGKRGVTRVPDASRPLHA